MNKYGQELWAIEFFTNESSANLTEWLKPQNALNREVSTSANISVDIREETLYTFLSLQIKLNMLFCIIRQVTLMILNSFVTVDYTIYRQIVIKSKTDPNKYYFFHGLIEKYSSRVTVVTRDGNPQSSKYIMCICKLNNNEIFTPCLCLYLT